MKYTEDLEIVMVVNSVAVKNYSLTDSTSKIFAAVTLLLYIATIWLLCGNMAIASALPPISNDIPLLKVSQQLPQYAPEPAVSLTAGGEYWLEYNDNIFRADNNTKSDIKAAINPAFRIKSDMRPYLLYLRGDVEVARWAKYSENNYENLDLRGRVGYESNAGSLLYAAAQYRYDHIAIGANADNPDFLAAEPTIYHYGKAIVGVSQESNNWLYAAEARYHQYDYRNARRRGGGIAIHDDRDRSEQELMLKIGRDIAPNRQVYVKGTVNWRNYDKRIDSTLQQGRDSNGYMLLSGVSWRNENDNLYADIALGYFWQYYDDAKMADPAAFAVDAILKWHPSDLWAVTCTAQRNLREATLAGVAGYIQSKLAVKTEYFYNQQWSFGLEGRWVNNDFQTNEFSGRPAREDDLLQTSLSAEYHIDKTYSLVAAYSHNLRNSDDSNIDYNANSLKFNLKIGY